MIVIVLLQKTCYGYADFLLLSSKMNCCRKKRPKIKHIITQCFHYICSHLRTWWIAVLKQT